MFAHVALLASAEDMAADALAAPAELVGPPLIQEIEPIRAMVPGAEITIACSSLVRSSTVLNWLCSGEAGLQRLTPPGERFFIALPTHRLA
jgi:hypothetical protein